MEDRADETSQMTQETGVLSNSKQAQKERHDPDQADRQLDGATRRGQDRVGQRLHLAGECGHQDGGQRYGDDETVEHVRAPG